MATQSTGQTKYMPFNGFGAYYIQKLLNLQFVGTAYTFLGIDLALCSNSGGPTALGTEISGGGYARLSVATTFFTAISGATTSMNNTTTIGWPQTTGSWGTVTTVFVVEHALSNILYGGDLVASQVVGNQNVFQFLANNFTVTLT
jgi:hypothetical protein